MGPAGTADGEGAKFWAALGKLMVGPGGAGAFWGVVYLRRRSVVAPVVSHSGFNLLQIVQFLVFAG